MVMTASSAAVGVPDIHADNHDDTLIQLKGLIERSGRLLPAQGPLTGFAFLNPLQGLEDLPFEEGMIKGARLFGCRPYLQQDFYREKLDSGRIILDDIKTVLRSELAAAATTRVAPSGTRFDVQL